MTTASTPPQPTRTLLVIFWVLLFAAGAEFIIRGPIRYLQPTYWSDLSQNYAASRLWLRGKNFSDPNNFVALWRDELSSQLDPTVRTRLAPTPGNLLLLAPIACLPFPLAQNIWLVWLLIAFAFTVWALMRTAGLRFPELRALAFISACLALTPFHTDIATGNESMIVVAFCALAILSATRHHDVSAGIWFGVACSLKPHLGALLVLYYLVRLRWRLFLTAIGTTSAITLVVAAWLQIRGVTWFHDYVHNLLGFATQNRIDDFTSLNPLRFLLINLQVPFFSFTQNAHSANLLALSTGALLICIWIALCLRIRHCADETAHLALSAIAVISLLPFYHRLYDATLLAIPLSWCLSRTQPVLKNQAKSSLLLILSFLLPGAALLYGLLRQGRIPLAWSNSWWWADFAMPHQTWILLLLSLVLLVAMFRVSTGWNSSTAGLTASTGK